MLIGSPGSGKTTLLGAVTNDIPRAERRYPFLHLAYYGIPSDDGHTDLVTGIELGGTGSGPFRGADRLGMAVQPLVVKTLDAKRWDNVIAEGDRLANAKFFTAVMQLGYDLSVIYLDTPFEVAAERRQQRAAQHNLTAQNAAWVKGRDTKCRRLAVQFNAMVYDGTASFPDLVARFRQEPGIRILRGV